MRLYCTVGACRFGDILKNKTSGISQNVRQKPASRLSVLQIYLASMARHKHEGGRNNFKFLLRLCERRFADSPPVEIAAHIRAGDKNRAINLHCVRGTFPSPRKLTVITCQCSFTDWWNDAIRTKKSFQTRRFISFHAFPQLCTGEGHFGLRQSEFCRLISSLPLSWKLYRAIQ